MPTDPPVNLQDDPSLPLMSAREKREYAAKQTADFLSGAGAFAAALGGNAGPGGTGGDEPEDEGNGAPPAPPAPPEPEPVGELNEADVLALEAQAALARRAAVARAAIVRHQMLAAVQTGRLVVRPGDLPALLKALPVEVVASGEAADGDALGEGAFLDSIGNLVPMRS